MTWLGTRAEGNLNQFKEMMWANGAFNDVVDVIWLQLIILKSEKILRNSKENHYCNRMY